MGSKLPTDLFPSPDRESEHLSMGSEGRQLRSRLVEMCNVCQKTLPTSTSKSFVSHIHCTCITPPSMATTVIAASMLPHKSKVVNVEMGESSKQQLFKEAIVYKPEIKKGVSSSSHITTTISENICKIKIKLDNENVSEIPTGIKLSRHMCSVCSKYFNTPGKLNQHMFCHTGEKPFVCNHCSKAFSSKFKLVRHILIHSDLRQYRCNVCERTFHRKDHLKNHSKVHSPVKRRFKCDRTECNKEYTSILSYRKHIAVHSAEEGNLECKICQKKFGTKEETLIHLKVHAGSRSLKTPADRKYHCDHCDRSFFTGKDVRRHLVVHTGRRDFLCQYCPQRFGRKDHLTRHIKKSHSSSTKKGKTRKMVLESEHNKSVSSILLKMFDENTSAIEEKQTNINKHKDDLYKIQALDNTVNVTKLKSSPDVLSVVSTDKKMNVDDDLAAYNIPMMTADIPFTKYEPYNLENYHFNQHQSSELAIPSTSNSIMPELVFQQPSTLFPPTMTFEATPNAENISKIVESSSPFPIQSESSTMDLILPISNISPTMGILSNVDLQNLLATSSSTASSNEGANNVDNKNITDHLYHLLANNPNELLTSLLSSSDPTNSTPLPGFNQAFHQSP